MGFISYQYNFRRSVVTMDFDQIKEDLELFTEWEDRYGYIIDLGKQISLPDEKKTDENKTKQGRAIK